MKTRQFHRLGNMPDEELFACLAVGLAFIADHARTLADASAASQGRASQLLDMVASEEAGKFLVLLDAVRAPRDGDQEQRVALFRRANDHLAKHLYAQVTNYHPDRFKELVGIIDSDRKSHYLDGPNDFDWIFRNAAEAERENLLYIDLVASDEELEWWSPHLRDRFSYVGPPDGVRLVAALADVGVATPEGLAIVAEAWRDYTPALEDRSGATLPPRIEETLTRLSEIDGAAATKDAVITIYDSWPFPLHSVELTKTAVKLSELRSRQEHALQAQFEADYGPFE